RLRDDHLVEQVAQPQPPAALRQLHEDVVGAERYLPRRIEVVPQSAQDPGMGVQEPDPCIHPLPVVLVRNAHPTVPSLDRHSYHRRANGGWPNPPPSTQVEGRRDPARLQTPQCTSLGGRRDGGGSVRGRGWPQGRLAVRSYWKRRGTPTDSDVPGTDRVI